MKIKSTLKITPSNLTFSKSQYLIHNFITRNTLREKCPNTEFFLIGIFPHSDLIRRDTPYLSVFSPNAGKYGPEKAPYLDSFHAVMCIFTGVLELAKRRYFPVLASKRFVENQ